MISLTPMQILPLNPCAMAWLILLPSFLAARVVPPCSLFPYTTLFRSPAGADPAAPLRAVVADDHPVVRDGLVAIDRKSTRLNSSHVATSYAGFCLKRKKTNIASRHFGGIGG